MDVDTLRTDQLRPALEATLKDLDRADGVIAELLARIIKAERQRDSFAAALAECPMFAELTNPDTRNNSMPITLAWRSEKIWQWMDARTGDVDAASQILAALTARLKREGAIEELQEFADDIRHDPELALYATSKDAAASLIASKLVHRILKLEKEAKG